MTAVVVRASPVDTTASDAIARHAVASVYAELALSPKPGLVCPDDPGSHADMDATTMLRSLFALRRGFRQMAIAAAAGAPFATLQAIGIDSEAAMRRATNGVNTHRGAIFQLGLLVASAAACAANNVPPNPDNLRSMLRSRWGPALRDREVTGTSHGLAMAARHGAGGARQEAADAFPTVFERVLPALQAARADGRSERAARLHALMTAIAHATDTNLLHRGGVDGLHDAQRRARDFLASGGVARDDHVDRLRAMGRHFVAANLSPGGSADLLAAALFVDRVSRRP